jgi:hypothetical protein
MLNGDNYIGSLLAALVSLRLFAFRPKVRRPTEDVLALITKASDRAPHLEYFAMTAKDSYWKRIGGEWVICDKTEFPSLVLEVHSHLLEI